MNNIQEFIKQRGIKYLVHLTRSENLPYILGEDFSCSGILPSNMLHDQSTIEHINVPNYEIPFPPERHVDKDDFVCCSIQNINYRLPFFNEKDPWGWAALLISPNVISEDSIFSRTATQNGQEDDKLNYSGLQSLFEPHVTVKNRILTRPVELKPSDTTDVEAEVLVKVIIRQRDIIGIAFPHNHQKVEQSRLKFYNHVNDLQVLDMSNTVLNMDKINIYRNMYKHAVSDKGQTFLF